MMRHVPVIKRQDKNRHEPPRTFTYYKKRYERRYVDKKLKTLYDAKSAASNMMSWAHYLKMIVVVFKVRGKKLIAIYQRDTRSGNPLYR